MPSPNSTALEARFNEVAAVSCVESQIKALSIMVKSPGAKAYQRARAARRELWQQLAQCAQSQIASLAAEPKPAVKRAPRVVAQQPSTSTAAEAAAS